jgi:hypothetical protein
MNNIRALRRWQRHIKIKAALVIIKRNWYDIDKPDSTLHREAVRHVDHLAICSCYMCRNYRRNDWQPNKERLTIQERRCNDIFNQWKQLDI